MTLSRCRIDPCLYTGRVFAEPVSTGQSLNNMAAFSCVFSVFIANETAFIFAMHGDFNRNAYNDIKKTAQKKRRKNNVLGTPQKRPGVINPGYYLA